MLRAIERDNYCLRPEYPERKSLRAGLWMIWLTLTSLLVSPRLRTNPQSLTVQDLRIKEL
jgi:hypothetical protein